MVKQTIQRVLLTDLIHSLSLINDHSPSKDFGHTAVGDLEDSGDITGPGAGVRQLDDLLPRRVGQRPPVHVHPAQLVHPAVP